jgi:hypothetical protein
MSVRSHCFQYSSQLGIAKIRAINEKCLLRSGENRVPRH